MEIAALVPDGAQDFARTTCSDGVGRSVGVGCRRSIVLGELVALTTSCGDDVERVMGFVRDYNSYRVCLSWVAQVTLV